MLITVQSLYWPARTITPDVRDWAIRAVGAGRAPGWVAKQIGVSPKTVSEWKRTAERKAKR